MQITLLHQQKALPHRSTEGLFPHLHEALLHHHTLSSISNRKPFLQPACTSTTRYPSESDGSPFYLNKWRPASYKKRPPVYTFGGGTCEMEIYMFGAIGTTLTVVAQRRHHQTYTHCPKYKLQGLAKMNLIFGAMGITFGGGAYEVGIYTRGNEYNFEGGGAKVPPPHTYSLPQV